MVVNYEIWCCSAYSFNLTVILRFLNLQLWLQHLDLQRENCCTIMSSSINYLSVQHQIMGALDVKLIHVLHEGIQKYFDESISKSVFATLCRSRLRGKKSLGLIALFDF